MIVPQGNGLASSLTAAENVLVPLLSTGVGVRDAHRRTDEALALVGLEESGSHLIEELSGGQQQRVALARAFAARAAVLLADEPTSDLDAANRERTVAALRAEAAAGRHRGDGDPRPGGGRAGGRRAAPRRGDRRVASPAGTLTGATRGVPGRGRAPWRHEPTVPAGRPRPRERRRGRRRRHPGTGRGRGVHRHRGRQHLPGRPRRAADRPRRPHRRPPAGPRARPRRPAAGLRRPPGGAPRRHRERRGRGGHRPGARRPDAVLQQRRDRLRRHGVVLRLLDEVRHRAVEGRLRAGHPHRPAAAARRRRRARGGPRRTRLRQRRRAQPRRVLRRRRGDRGPHGRPPLAHRGAGRHHATSSSTDLPGYPDNIARGSDGLDLGHPRLPA